MRINERWLNIYGFCYIYVFEVKVLKENIYYKIVFFLNFDNKLRNVNWKLNINCFEIKFIRILINDINFKWFLNLIII